MKTNRRRFLGLLGTTFVSTVTPTTAEQKEARREVCGRKAWKYPPQCVGPDRCRWTDCYKVKHYQKHKNDKKVDKVLKVGKCPKCRAWMYTAVPMKVPLPDSTRRKYHYVEMDCRCPNCDYMETEEILCVVSPRVQKGK